MQCSRCQNLTFRLRVRMFDEQKVDAPYYTNYIAPSAQKNVIFIKETVENQVIVKLEIKVPWACSNWYSTSQTGALYLRIKGSIY